MEKFSLL